MQVFGCFVHPDCQDIAVTHNGRGRGWPFQDSTRCLTRITNGKGSTPLVSCRDREFSSRECIQVGGATPVKGISIDSGSQMCNLRMAKMQQMLHSSMHTSLDI